MSTIAHMTSSLLKGQKEKKRNEISLLPTSVE